MVEHIPTQPSSHISASLPPSAVIDCFFKAASSGLVLLASGLPKHTTQHYCIQLLPGSSPFPQPAEPPSATATTQPSPGLPATVAEVQRQPWLKAGALSERDGEPHQADRGAQAPKRSLTPYHHTFMYNEGSAAPSLHGCRCLAKRRENWTRWFKLS